MNSKISVETPDMLGCKASRHVSRETVHGGNHFPKLAAFTVDGIACAWRRCSTQSWGEPFQWVHQDAGQRQS